MSLSNQINSQRGIGLAEVMVALFLLAITVLGFSAMQMAAVKSTDESLMRTRALAIMRSGAETMRAHPQAIATFQSVLNSPDAPSATDLNSCLGAVTCTTDDIARKDASILKQFARSQGIELALRTCPGQSAASSSASATSATGQARHCMIASWEGTSANFGSDTNCADASGAQNSGASCFIMEAY